MIRKDKADWTEQVATSLREAEEPLPAGGWQRLERETRVSGSVTAHVLKRKWIGYAAAAASILICVSIGVQVLRMNHNVMNNGVVSVSETVVGGHAEGTETRGVSVPSSHIGTNLKGCAESSGADGNLLRAGVAQPSGSEDGTITCRPAKDLRRMESSAFSGENATVAGMPAANSPEAGCPRDRNAGVSVAISGRPVPSELRTVKKTEMRSLTLFGVQPGTSSAQTASEKSGVSRYRTADYDGLFAEAAPARRKHSGSAGVFAAGVIAGSKGSKFMGGPLYSAVLVDKNEVMDLRDAYGSYFFEHKQPLSFGLTFRREFKYGLSLETGLNYTLLRSDVAVTGKVREIRQQLHFIGIPLRVNWRFLRVGRFSMYVGAGGMGEKCVYARFGAEKITEPKVQWSLSGILGAQCLLGRSVGIYFEPSVSHYLTHTSLRTAYTDSSAALDLRFGLRFTY